MSKFNLREVEILRVKFVKGQWEITYWESQYTNRFGFVKYPSPFTINLLGKSLPIHVSQNFAYVKYYIERFCFGYE